MAARGVLQRAGGSRAPHRLHAISALLIGCAIGAAGIHVGATDDAPGASLLGAVVMVGAAALALKLWRRKRD